MEVILLEKVKNLGALGSRVKVKPGYARNYLIPQGKASPATPQNLAAFEARRAELERIEAEQLAAARTHGETLAALHTIVVRQRAGAEGRLFGSVGPQDIATALGIAGITVDRSQVRLPNGPLRTTGDHDVEIHLHSEVNAPLVVSVMADN